MIEKFEVGKKYKNIGNDIVYDCTYVCKNGNAVFEWTRFNVMNSYLSRSNSSLNMEEYVEPVEFWLVYKEGSMLLYPIRANGKHGFDEDYVKRNYKGYAYKKVSFP
jgi:hypothetical protein